MHCIFLDVQNDRLKPLFKSLSVYSLDDLQSVWYYVWYSAKNVDLN